ncbi:MAG: alpha/beta fold hydrolase [Nocardioidaceae bacterium]
MTQPDGTRLLSEETVRLPDGRLAQLSVGGDPRGPAVFFLHGCPDTRRAAWSGHAVAERLGLRLIAVNRPGYGLSTAHDSGHLTVADDVAVVADLLGVAGFAVLGMSVGGPYALACAARHPDRVTAAAIVSAPGMAVAMRPPVHRDDLSDDQVAFFRRLAGVSAVEGMGLVRPEFERYVAQLDPGDPDEDALARRWLEGLPPPDAALMASLPASDVAASLRESLAQLEGYLRDAVVTFRGWPFDVADVRCPVSLWYGDLDANAPPRNGIWLAERIGGATLSVREQTSHLGALLLQWEPILTMLRRASSRS